jgi:hypothetical protein
LFDVKKTEGQKSRHTVLFKISAPKFWLPDRYRTEKNNHAGAVPVPD